MQSDPMIGAHALMRGANLLTRKELRPFIIMPLLINLVLFVILTAILISQIGGLADYFSSLLSSTPVDTEGMVWWKAWLAKGGSWAASAFEWLAWIIILAAIFVFLLAYGYSFGIISNLIAAPFNGFLAEKVEELLTGEPPPAESIPSMVFRTLGRELQKLWYFIRWGLLIFIVSLLLGFIPLINLAVPVLVFLWGAWSMAIQYVDYPLDNHQQPFDVVKRDLKRKHVSTLGFGSSVMLAKMIPLVNIFVMPAAVAGATAYWIEHLREGRPNQRGQSQSSDPNG
ncbi:sulfate transporter CysZ [Biformimicrobium ophioploci]|uniref:Sulfate transporter CysZ n=1 Tax=Biformimicrobium ophioploci TaxID=3036711 RepID=A0ABQ6LWV1_9GAMM|nr:sulfate transporter CysZ [Microbulbifer sp. NKW57]GMG86582.1 sulfate transporter CysZ [Microbulbifer sp. NKW57]